MRRLLNALHDQHIPRSLDDGRYLREPVAIAFVVSLYSPFCYLRSKSLQDDSRANLFFQTTILARYLYGTMTVFKLTLCPTFDYTDIFAMIAARIQFENDLQII